MAKKIMINCPRSVENAWAKMLEEATLSYIKELAKKRVNFETTSLEDAMKLINFEFKSTKKKKTTKAKNDSNGNKGPHKRPPGRAKKGKKWCTYRKWVDIDAPDYDPNGESKDGDDDDNSSVSSSGSNNNDELEERKQEDSNEEPENNSKKAKKRRLVTKKKKKKPEPEPEPETEEEEEDVSGFNLGDISSDSSDSSDDGF